MAVKQRQVMDMGSSTVAQLFARACRERGEAVALRKKERGIWREVTWTQYGSFARQAGLGMAALGVGRGDTISIIADPVLEWVYSDHGALGLGAVSNGIYTTDSPRQVQYILEDSGTVLCVVENQEQLDKVLEVRHLCTKLRWIIVCDMEGLRGLDDPMVFSFDRLLELGQQRESEKPDEWETAVANGRPEDLAVLIYTSGTTGMSKGVMLTNRNLAKLIENGTQALKFRADDEQVSFLPLCHVAERSWTSLFPLKVGQVVNFVESVETTADNIQEVQPTALFAVPRFWEKFYSNVQVKIKEATPFNRWCYERAIGIGYRIADAKLRGSQPPLPLTAAFFCANHLVLSNIKRMIGINRSRFLVTGAAPIAPELIRWYFALGVPMLELYGMTETSGIATAPPCDEYRLGSVGKPVPGMEFRLGDGEEIQLKGANIFEGYRNLPEKMAETFVDGWLKTGDVGRVDADGWVYVTDRLKDILITAGGKNITPSEIENQLKFSPYIADAVVLGDKRKFLSCLIMIDHENVAQFAQDRAIPFTDYQSLCRAPEIRRLMGDQVEIVNQRFSRVEAIRKFHLIEELLTTEDEELTPTMKLKRKAVERRYQSAIEEMYAEGR